MTVLVTGGSGLVGSHVIEALVGGGEAVRALVRAPSRPAVERLGAVAVPGDVTDPAAWRRATDGARAIVHAAALVLRPAGWDAHVAVNVDATRQAVEAARAEGARLVHVSTVAVYGGSAAYDLGGGHIAEDFPFRPIPPRDFYARSKRLAEELVRDEAQRGGLSAVAIRPNVIYGERDRLFTPKVVRALRLGVVPQIGAGRNHLACVYAGNVAAAIVAALDAPVAGFRAYNVTADAEPRLSQREFLDALAAALGLRIRRLAIPAFPARLVLALLAGPQLARAALRFATDDNPYSAERARRELGWNPPFSTPTAVARTARWFRTNETPGR